MVKPEVRIRIRYQESRMGKKSRSRSGITIRDEHPGSFFRELRNNFRVKILKFFDMDPDPGSGGGGWKYSDPDILGKTNLNEDQCWTRIRPSYMNTWSGRYCTFRHKERALGWEHHTPALWSRPARPRPGAGLSPPSAQTAAPPGGSPSQNIQNNFFSPVQTVKKIKLGVQHMEMAKKISSKIHCGDDLCLYSFFL